MGRRFIRVEGARQNNLKDISVRVPVGSVTAVTGVAGAGKSSLAFDVLHAEGYRRYVETFSPYARQFLERFDRPRADRIDGGKVGKGDILLLLAESESGKVECPLFPRDHAPVPFPY